MRILSVNNLRLGASPANIPAFLTIDARAFSTRAAWQRAISFVIRENIDTVLLSGDTFSSTNHTFEPWGPLTDGLAELARADVSVFAVERNDFNPLNLARFAPEAEVAWISESLETDDTTIHIVAGSLAERADAPVNNPITLESIDEPNSIWILTDALQPDSVSAENAIVIEPGSASPLSAAETGRHGAWLIDTATRDVHLIPLANIEFASVDIDIHAADDLDTLERTITASLIDTANIARNDGSIANTLLADITLTGRSRLYPALAETASELQRMLVIEHEGVDITISRIIIDATPAIDLEPLLNRPDPVGEVARLIHALDVGDLSETQQRLLTNAEQKLLSVSHARVFGSVVDLNVEIDAPTLLRRQSWATLDALVRQRGID